MVIRHLLGGGGDTPFIRPNVSYCKLEEEVHYNPHFVAKTYAVHGYADTTNNMLYVESGYYNFINELNTDRPSGADLIDGILICHFMDNDETVKYVFDDGSKPLTGYATEYSDVEDLPQGVSEMYAITYQYEVKDSLGRSVSQTIDLGDYAEDYNFIEEVREDMFFGGGGDGQAPPSSMIWAWKGTGGKSGNNFIYVLPSTTFNNFLDDVATYYNLSLAEDDTYGAKGLQIKNFIIYFPDESASYNCFLDYSADSTDGISTLYDYYVAGFAYVDDDGIFHNLDISDFVASLSSDSPYLNYLEEISSDVLRGGDAPEPPPVG